MDTVFFLVIRNKYLLNKILKYCRIYQIKKYNYNQINFKSLKQLGEHHDKNISKLTFAYNFNIKLYPNCIPDTVRSINLRGYKRDLETENVFPKELEELYFSYGYQRNIEPGVLPQGLKVLKLSYFQEICEGILPSSLETLMIDNSCRITEKSLPSTLKRLHLGFGITFTKVEVIPNTIEDLIVECPIFGNLKRGFIPESVKNLVLNDYSGGIVGCLPKNLKSLVLRSFNDYIEEGDLPEGLELLDLGGSFNSDIHQNVLPISLKSLHFPRLKKNPFKFNGLSNLIHIKSLYLPNYFSFKLNPGDLPPQLENLYVNRSYNMEIDENVLPNTLKKIEFGQDYNCEIKKGVLPDSLEILKFPKTSLFNHPLNECLPNGLKEIILGGNFTEIISLPNSIIKFILKSQNFNRIIDIPKSCEFMCCYSNDLQLDRFSIPSMRSYLFNGELNLSQSIEKLILKSKFERDYNFHNMLLPSSIIWLEIKILAYNLKNMISKLTSLKYLSTFTTEEIMPSTFPESLEILKFENHHNYQIYGHLFPKSLKELYLPMEYQYEIKNLPDTIEILSFGHLSNISSLKLSQLPKSIKLLKFGERIDISTLDPDILESVPIFQEKDESHLFTFKEFN